MTDNLTVNEALSRFETLVPRFERAGEAVCEHLSAVLGAWGLQARLSHRVKEVSSYRTKIERKQYRDPWNDVTDKIGVRALVELAEDVDRIHSAIVVDGKLAVVAVTDKRQELDVEQLGYSGLHLDVLAPAEDGDEWPIQCEIQIRTVAQDAWSVVSHRLLYKPEVDLPAGDRRALMRLVALVEIFDEEVARVMKSYTQQAATVVEVAAILGSAYSTFANNSWSPELTNEIVVALEPVVGDPSLYVSRFNDWLSGSRDALVQLYGEYGAGSAMDTVSDYLLWSQPESLLLLHLLDTTPHAAVDAWNRAGLPLNWLRPIAAHSSSDIEI